MTALAQKQYFDDVVTAMKARGFALFSYVITEQTEELRYRVDAKTARDTRLFFHYPNTCLIVVLVYREDDSFRRDLEGYWSIQLDYEFLPIRDMVRRTYIRDSDVKDVPREECRLDKIGNWERKVPLWNSATDDTLYPNFHRVSSGLEQRCAPGSLRHDNLTPERIVQNVWGYIGKSVYYFKKGMFDELQVTNFTPHYTFRGCEMEFWEKFKDASGKISTSRYLWSLVGRPWGSDGLRR